MIQQPIRLGNGIDAEYPVFRLTGVTGSLVDSLIGDASAPAFHAEGDDHPFVDPDQTDL